MSGQRRLLDNKLTSEGKLDSINSENGGNTNDKALKIKEISCACGTKKNKKKR